MRYSFIATGFFSTIILGACHPSDQTAKPDFLSADIDTTVSPSEDFFLYANGGWIKKTPIPDAESGWGIGNLVQEEIYSRLKKINTDAENEKAAEGTLTQKIGDFWYSGMDSVSIDRNGLAPLKSDMDQIDAIRSKKDLIDLTAVFHDKGMNVLFNDYVAQDDKNSEVMAYMLGQGGLGMPNREYYFNTDERTVQVRKNYREYLFKTFKQMDPDSLGAVKKSNAVFDLENKLAKASRKLADLRDPYKNYHKMNLPALENLSGAINWTDYLQRIGIRKLDSVIVGQPEFYVELNKEIIQTGLEDWKNYLRFHLIRSSAAFLDSQSFKNAFEFRKSLTGAKEPRVRWKRILDAEEGAMGEALGQLFVKEYFNEKAKQRYIDMVEAIRDAYKDRIKRLEWMSEGTKQKAYDKLAKITRKVGYPDKWKDFSALKINRGPFVLNMQRANQWWHNYNVSKLGKPVDRTEWDMSPQTYNAYYNQSNNEIVLPAGIFAVPGMRDEELDDAFVYGYSAASTIGHEITHGFDDQGRQYDEKGNLRNWWEKKDSAEFVLRAKKIITQFNEFSPVDTLHINGDATQGENIADLGGLLLGLDAFKKTPAFKKGEVIGGLTQLQRYFLGYAYGWLYQQRKESLASQVMTDVHAPAKERVNAPMVNIPEFYDAFKIRPGTKMYRPDSLRVNIW
ncbi:MAG TPA: M13 family metallopeptidase [Puia sp.]|nr:M13 family metallopeptidase [Puia sp.]